MLKPTIFSFACIFSIVTAACVADEDKQPVTDAEELSTIESSLEPVPICGDLLNQYFETIQSCTKNGQLGTKECHRTCDIYRSMVFQPGFPPTRTCRIDEVECTPDVCGPCEVFEWEGPLGPL